MIEKSDRPGDINQALIELGSTVCKARDPSCGSCPLKTHCKAHQEVQVGVPCISHIRKAYNILQGMNHTDTDIEELCTICEPFPLDVSICVTKYPMKCSKKKAREELDIVNIIEWTPGASGSSAAQRYFLLVKRPEKGLLAGLHEFPTLPNVGSEGSSDAGMKKAAMGVLETMLKERPISLAKATKVKDDAKDATLRVVHIKPAGDVLHIFSHIRKTYRVQWVLLSDGSSLDPPALQKVITDENIVSQQQKSNKKVKIATENEGIDGSADITPLSSLRWVKEEDVLDAKYVSVTRCGVLHRNADNPLQSSVGTGVLKVWNKARELWERDRA